MHGDNYAQASLLKFEYLSVSFEAVTRNRYETYSTPAFREMDLYSKHMKDFQ